MSSKIVNLKETYGKFTELLPEELVSDMIEKELRSNNSKLIQIFEEDLGFVKELLAKHNINIPFEKFPNYVYTIRKAFFLEKEQIKRTNELIKRMLAQWWICKEVLSYLSKYITKELLSVKQYFNDYTGYQLEASKKRVAFIWLTRSYQNFIGYVVNILDIIDEYIDAFDRVCKEIDKNYKVTIERHVSAISIHELDYGAKELLLRGNNGRFTAFPLVRSLIEVMVTRKLLNPRCSVKYKSSHILPLRGFDIRELMKKMNVGSTCQRDSVERIYDWASISLHRAIRMPHSGIWYSLLFTETILSNMLNNIQRVGPQLDSFLENLQSDKKIEII
jgi:hypothetical protein